ncbi:MAG TPA: hypothetical protein VGF67_29055 [Ktedonobacteraceae bacterium]|jgi:hypothetical protein
MQEQESAQIRVEIISEEPELIDSIDVALIGEVRTAVFRQLEQDGFALSLEETHQRGGDVAFLVGMEIARMAQMAWDHHHEILEAIGDLGTLYLLLEKAVHIARRLNQAWQKQVRSADDPACTVTLQIDGVSLTLETNQLEQPDSALQLAQRFAQLAPEVARQVNARSQVHLQGRVPKHQRRKHKGRR